MTHVYKELSEAEHDLKLFSNMNMNEDKTLYLVVIPMGMQIVKEPGDVAIEAIARNGKLFVAK